MFAALLAEGAWTLGCRSASAPPPPPPPPLSITVTVAPASGSLVLGGQATFTATVTNTTDTTVTWSVSGVPGGSTALGTITSAGVYTAPADLPSPATVLITTTSHADSTKSGSGNLAITSDISLILTQNQTASGRLTEIEQVIAQWLAVWSGVSGTTLVPAAFTPLSRTAARTACGPDGVNSICFDQADTAFTPGVLAFTRVITTDRLGVKVGSSAISTQLGQILDADIYFNPSDSNTAYATPLALAANPKAYDLESLLTHELGHFLGFSHSAVWSAIMFPFAPAPGTFSGAQVVAVDATSGAAAGATFAGWSCFSPGPAQFDGT